MNFFLQKIFSAHKCILIAESKTQKKYRGKDSILNNYSRFAKFLHKGFSEGVNIIVVCVDNDNNPCDSHGIGSTVKNKLMEYHSKFLEENKTNTYYSSINPNMVYAVPVETIDYWMKCVDERTTNCHKIREILRISRFSIKESTYGSSNVYARVFVDPEAIESKKTKISQDPMCWEKLRCFPSFSDFETQLLSIPQNH